MPDFSRVWQKALPKMLKSPGAICEQYVKCGRSNCRCNSGELHGPYHYHFYRDELGKLRKRYVRRDEVKGKRAELAIRKASNARLDVMIRQTLPPKRTRNYDFLTGIGRMARVIDSAFGLLPKQGRDDAGRFTKIQG